MIDKNGHSDPPSTSPAPAALICLIGIDEATRAAVSGPLARLAPGWPVIEVAEPASSIGSDHGGRVTLYGLQWPTDDEAGYRTLALIKSLNPATPVVILHSDAVRPDTARALEHGAWDTLGVDDAALLEAKLQRAVATTDRALALIDCERRLSSAQRRLEVLLSDGQDAHARLEDGAIHDANAAFARLLGADAIESLNARPLAEWVGATAQSELAEALERVRGQATDASLVFQPAHARPGQGKVRALLRPDGNDTIDIVLRVAEDQRPRSPDPAPRSVADGRMALHEVLAQSASRAQDRVLGLLMVVVDDVERLQEQLGLARGDLLLQEASLFLLQSARGNDRCFRFGAGEYAMLIERESRDQVEAAARRLLAAFREEMFSNDTHTLSLTVSIAHTVLAGEAAENDRRLGQCVEAARGLEMRGGNDCIVCADTDGETEDPEAADEWSARLRQALAQDRFSLAYQGVTSLAGDSHTYFDVLLRYIDDRGALVRAGQFLAVAERSGMMADIDRWVIRRASDVIAEQMARDNHIALFVKLSVATITAGSEFLDWLDETMRAQASVPSHQIIFSFREDDVRSQSGAVHQLAVKLHGMGFRLALTHFGSSPKAAQILENLPLAFIKLAPEFARQVAGDTESERLRHIISSAREHQIPLIAEQIEDANSMARLWQAGVNYVQGHFIQEPDTEALKHGESRLS